MKGQSVYPGGRPKGSTGHAAELRRLEEAALVLAGIYYGAQYGGSTTAILLKMPGESASVVTCLDGYAMARQDRAGPALAIAALGSFFAGCVAMVFVEEDQ